MVTARQRKARALFVKRVRSGAFRRKKRSTRRRASKPTRSYRRRSVNMARRYRKTRRRRSGLGGLGGVKSIVKLAGGAMLGGVLLAKVAPQVPMPGAVAGFVIGGLPGAITGAITPYALSQLTGLMGNGTSGGAWPE